MNHRTFAKLSVLCCISASIAGCAGMHLHDQADADLARQAQDQLKAADLTTMVDGERKVIDSLLDRQLTVSRRDYKAQRDAGLVDFIGGTDTANSWTKFIDEVNNRLVALAGKDTDRLYKAFTDRERSAGFLETEERLYQSMRQNGDPEFVWPLPAGVKEDGSTISAIAKGHFLECVSAAKEIDDAQKTIDAADSGLLGELTQQIREAQTAVAHVNATVQTATNEYKASSDKYEAAVAKADDPLGITKAAGEVESRLADFDKLSLSPGDEKALEKNGLSGFKALGSLAALDERRKSISALLDRVAQSASGQKPATRPADSKSTQFYLTVAADVPAIANALANAHHSGDVSVLLLESQRLKIQEDDAKRKLASAQDRLDLLKKQQAAAVLELRYLEKAWDSLRDCTTYRMKLDGNDTTATEPSAGAFRSSLAQDFSGPAPAGKDAEQKSLRASIAAALLAYGNSWTLGRSVEAEMDYRLIHSQSVEALDRSQTALAEWNDLIGVPLTQLAALHEGGLKSDDVAKLAELIALGAIGYGVN